MNDKQGILTIISGFSGAGKGTIMSRLIQKYDNYSLSISATTRKPRPGEEEGVHYFFKTVEEFQKMIEEGEFLEYARYVDNYYGTPKQYVTEQMKQGKDVLLEIDLQGALQVKEIYPEALLVFVTTKSAEILEYRLRGRGTETEEVIQSRLKRAVEEAEFMDRYEFIVINDDLDTAVDQLHDLIQSAHMKSGVMEDFIASMKTDVNSFLKGEK